MLKQIVKKTFCILIPFSYIFISQNNVSNAEVMRCNVNSDCRPGFVCVGGMGQYADSSKKTGCCVIILPLRQVCLFHGLMTGKFGRGVVVLVVVSMGFGGIFGKLGYKSLLTFFVGTVCIFGSYQVVGLITGYSFIMCETVDTTKDIGQCGDADEDSDGVYAYNYNIQTIKM